MLNPLVAILFTATFTGMMRRPGLHSCRYLPLLLCLIFSYQKGWTQSLDGVVYDRNTNETVRGVSITVGPVRVVSDLRGRFSLPHLNRFPIVVTASHIGYDSVSITLYSPPDTRLWIPLSAKTFGLDEVTIYGKRNSVQDSLRMRQEFYDQFNFKPTKPWESVSISPIGIGINLNMLYASLSREQKQTKRLKAALIRDEREDYIDRRFTNAAIQAQTAIADDELEVFKWYFRPSYGQLINFTDYDLLIYIQEKYRDFKKHRETYRTTVPVFDKNGIND